MPRAVSKFTGSSVNAQENSTISKGCQYSSGINKQSSIRKECTLLMQRTRSHTKTSPSSQNCAQIHTEALYVYINVQ